MRFVVWFINFLVIVCELLLKIEVAQKELLDSGLRPGFAEPL